MEIYEIEISFSTGDSIVIEIEAENREEALSMAVPTYYQIVRDGE